jgi:GTPase KRas protein
MNIVEGRELAKQFNSRLIESSAKQRINVDESFYNLVREIRRFNKEAHSQPQSGTFGYSQQGQGYGNQMDDKEDKGCCCLIM